MKSVIFFVAYPYYFPHFLPISKVLKKRGYSTEFVLSSKDNIELMKQISKENSEKYSLDKNRLFQDDVDFVFFANNYENANKIKATTIFLEHGIGTKSTSFYCSIEYFDIYLVEGKFKRKRLEKLYPQYVDKIKEVGFSKYDDIINMTSQQKENLYKKYKIDSSKKTILYAPTFFPSSIEKMDDKFPDEFKNCNIIIKPHYLTYGLKKYKRQRKKLNHWATFDNCVVMSSDEYNLIPFLIISDVMISDESSAMFEFAGLNKPVISNRYFKLRWSYYLFPKKLAKRIDIKKDKYRNILDNADNYSETIKKTREALNNPSRLEKQRLNFIDDILGVVDGKVSERVIDILNERL